MFYNRYDTALKPHKQTPLNRRIHRFGEHSWWEWSRLFPHCEGARIYMNAKTRHPEPFFSSAEQAFDGSML